MESSAVVQRVAPTDDELYVKYSRILPTDKGQCIDAIGKEQVPESLVCRYFGQKSSKSGWKYDCQQTPEEAAAIYDLWQRVYDERLMPNREISLQFARGLILQSQGMVVDWVEFAVGREKYRTRPTSMKGGPGGKKLVGRKEVHSKDIGGITSGVSILGKRRCVASSPPPLFKLTIKEEGCDELITEKKEPAKSGNKSKNIGFSGYFPNWEASEVDNIVDGVLGYDQLAAELKLELHERSAEKEMLEIEARRARMQLSDRLTLLEQEKLEVAKLFAEETVLLSAATGLVSTVAAPSETKQEELSFNRRFLERTIAHSNKIVAECQASIESIEGLIVKSSSKLSMVVSRVSCLESILLRMRDLLGSMQQGGGNVFFPRPLFSNPESPISPVHYLNACPVCGFWYSCNNFVSLSCGHTYHHWCLSEHTKKSTNCIFESCGESLLGESAAAIGIRPGLVQGVSARVVVRSDAHPITGSSAPSKDNHPLQEAESERWGSEKSKKDVQPQSQSSETNVVSNLCPLAPITSQEGRSTCLVCKTNEATIILQVFSTLFIPISPYSCSSKIILFKLLLILNNVPNQSSYLIYNL